MKKIVIILLTLIVSIDCMSQKTDTSSVVAVSTLNKDTLYLANNELGCMIEEAWEMGDQKKPIIIFKPEEWILQEYFKIKNKT